MASARATIEGPFARSVREAIESVASPDVARRVISMSLVSAGRSGIPEDVVPFTAYLEGPLRSVVVQVLDLGSYELVAQRLGHVVAMATSQIMSRGEPALELDLADYEEEDSRVRLSKPPGFDGAELPDVDELLDLPEVPTQPRATPARPPEPTTSSLPDRLLVLTLDGSLVDDMRRRIESYSATSVLQISSLRELQVAALLPGRCAIVLDAALPSIDAPTLASAAGELPATVRVVLWGMTDAQRDRFAAHFVVARSWIAGGLAGSPLDALLELD